MRYLPLVLVVVVVLGCGEGPKPVAEKEKKKHDHPEEGPHDGPLADWDDKYHAEFTVDHKTKTARVYILGPDAKTPTPIASAVVKLSLKKPRLQIDLKPERQKEDPEGKASVFTGVHDALGKEGDFQGTLSAEIDGKQYANEFKGHGHVHEK